MHASRSFLAHTPVSHLPQPVFLQETSDCSYLFEWRTQYACPPFDLTECSFK